MIQNNKRHTISQKPNPNHKPDTMNTTTPSFSDLVAQLRDGRTDNPNSAHHNDHHNDPLTMQPTTNPADIADTTEPHTEPTTSPGCEQENNPDEFTPDESQVTGNLSVHYQTTRGGLSVTHKRLTKDNCTVTGASDKALRTVAKVFESRGTPVGKIISLFAQTRRKIAELGLRLPTGGHLIRASYLDRVQEIFDESEDELRRLRGELRTKYPEMVATSKTRLGSAAPDIVFPPAEELAGRFTQTLVYAPDPTSGDVLIQGVADEVAAKIRAQVNRSRDLIVEEAQDNVIRDLLRIVEGDGESDEGIVGALASNKQLRKTRFERLKKRLEVAKGFVEGSHPRLQRTIEALEPVANLDLDEARVAVTKRVDASRQAESAVATLAGLGITLS